MKHRILSLILICSIIFAQLGVVLAPARVFADDVPTDTSSVTTPPADTSSSSTSSGDSTTVSPVISTGDATSNSTTQTVANTTDVKPNLPFQITTGTDATSSTSDTANTSSTTSDIPTTPTASSTDPSQESQGTTTDIHDGGGLPLLTASTTNTVDASTSVDTEASTGTNTASSTEEATTTTLIQTGDAYANANIINAVNINIFDSTALMAFINNLQNGGNVDLRDSSFFSEEAAQTGTSTPCLVCSPIVPTKIIADTNNQATISNTVVVRADTGNNNASGNSNVISTGNAYANANVVNIANSTMIDSHYLLLVMNNFGSVNGDVVLPTADFFTKFLTQSQTAPLLNTITTNNTDTTTNAVNVDADTGNNTATGTVTILTGNAGATTNILNDSNTTKIGGSSLRILFHVFGNWDGQVFNAPPGISWMSTPSGIVMYNTGDTGTSTGAGSVTASTTNTSSLQNNVQVYALTGNNQINGNGAISTGNAYANANVENMTNTTIVGHNWLTAFVNIFGDFHGNISFGQPDLWVGETVEGPQIIGQGALMTHHITLKNKGDAPAHNVLLTLSFDKPYIRYIDSTSTASTDTKVIDVGTLNPGQEVTYAYNISSALSLPSGETDVVAKAQATETESDGDTASNTDVLSLVLSGPLPGGSGPGVQSVSLPDLVVTKTSSVATTTASSTVHYVITVQNKGEGSAYNSELVDTLTDALGTEIHTQSWDLDEIHPHESITVEYDMVFASSTVPGNYKNNAQVYADSFDPDHGSEYDTQVVSSSIAIIGEEPATTTPAILPFTIHKTSPTHRILDIESSTTKTEAPVATTTIISSVHPDTTTSKLAAVLSAFNSTTNKYLLYMFLILALGYLSSKHYSALKNYSGKFMSIFF